MADVIYVGALCAFFALCVIYIRWCDRIIGSDEEIALPPGEAAGTPAADTALLAPLYSEVTP